MEDFLNSFLSFDFLFILVQLFHSPLRLKILRNILFLLNVLETNFRTIFEFSFALACLCFIQKVSIDISKSLDLFYLCISRYFCNNPFPKSLDFLTFYSSLRFRRNIIIRLLSSHNSLLYLRSFLFQSIHERFYFMSSIFNRR